MLDQSNAIEVIPRDVLARLEHAAVAVLALPVSLLLGAVLFPAWSGSKGIVEWLRIRPSETLTLACLGVLAGIVQCVGHRVSYRFRVAAVLVALLCGTWLIVSLAAGYGLSLIVQGFRPE